MKFNIFRGIFLRVGLIVFVGLLSFLVNMKFLGNSSETESFSLRSIYLFFGFSAFIIYLTIELLVTYLKDRSAYLFLFFILIKLGLFILIFLGRAETGQPVMLHEKLSMIAALFIFTTLEAVLTFKVLKYRLNDLISQ